MLVLVLAASGCGVVQDGIRGIKGRDCPAHVKLAMAQIDTASAKLRSVQNSSSSGEARSRATAGVASLRKGLATMRDHGDCFVDKDRAWAVQNLRIWKDGKAVAKVVDCYDTKLSEGSVPEFCNFRR